MPEDDALLRALDCLPPERLAKATEARLRYQRRQIRLDRLAKEREQHRRLMLNDPIARALAKAQAASKDIDGDAN